MQNLRKPVLVVLIMLAFGIIGSALWVNHNLSNAVFAQQSRKEDDDEPVADYTSAQQTGEVREAKSRRHNKKGVGAVNELPPDVEELPVNVHWWQGLAALPIAQSDAVVLGTVIDRQAYLSSDKTGVYSEFTIRTEQILKASTQIAINQGDTIVAERSGGAVRFSSGKIQHYNINKQKFPKKDRRYVFFVQSNGQDFSIVTAYELRDGGVFPLDGSEGNHPNGKLPFAKYDGIDESSFLNILRQEITRYLQMPPKEGGQK